MLSIASEKSKISYAKIFCSPQSNEKLTKKLYQKNYYRLNLKILIP